MLACRYIICIFALTATAAVHAGRPLRLPVSDVSSPDADCVPYDELIIDAVMTSSVSYLADNPRGEDAPISRSDVTPFTPTRLFQVFYKGKASSVEFKRSLLTFVHAKYLNDTKVDRVQFRKNLYKAARAGSWELSREIMSHLLLMIVSDYTDQTWYWRKYRCVPSHGRNAAEMAITIELARLRNEIGETSFGQFLDLGVGTTLAFVIDDTGSMSGEINAAKKRVERITDHLRNSTDSPQEYLLVPFNDPFVPQVTNTRSASQFKRSLSRLYAHGGGDLPEMAMSGIQLAIENCRPGSTIYVITDAPAKDYKQQDGVIAQAIEKQIVIVVLLTNGLSNCHQRSDEAGSGGVKTMGTKSGNFKTCFNLYQQLADKTGGRVMVVGKKEIFRATEIIQSSLKQGLVVLKRQLINFDTTTSDFRDIGFLFDVDPSITEIVVEASGQCGSLNITNVDGDVTTELQRVGETYTASIKTQDHPAGRWAVMGTTGNTGARAAAGSCEIKASGKSTAGFVLTTVVKEQNQPDTAYRVLNGMPSVEHSVGFLLDFYGLNDINNTDVRQRIERVRFVNEKGLDVITPLNLMGNSRISVNKTSLQFYMEEGLPLNVHPFYVVIEGRLQGKHFSRVSNRLMSVSHTDVQCQIENVVFRAGFESYFKVKVTNNGPREDNFTMTVSDEKSFASLNGTSNNELQIKAHSSRYFVVRVNVPETLAEGTASKITISAKGWRPGSFQYHVCTIVLGQNKRPKVNSFQIRGTISSRFAETTVRSTVTNDADVARDAEFEVMLPAEAFISNLTMEIGNETVVGSIEEKVKAKKLFNKARKLGKVAGHVAVRDHSTQVYRTNLLVPARTTVVFQLTYQQLLKRIRGMYEYSLVIDPDQPVRHLNVDVNILENSPIKFVSVPGFKTDQTNRRNFEEEIIDSFDGGDQNGGDKSSSTRQGGAESSTSITFNHDRHGCHVRYQPSLTIQTAHSPLGMQGVYTIQFDVSREQSSGKSVVAGGYFAHFFSAPFLPNPPKMLTFVIDVSGSMLGHKMAQVKQALRNAINSLQPEDYFNLVFFNNRPKAWIPSIMAPVKDIDIEDAIDYISKYEPEGGTNIGEAFDLAFDLMTPYLAAPEQAEASGDDDYDLLEFDVMHDVTAHQPENLDDFEEMHDRARRSLRKRAETDNVREHSKMIVFLTDGKPTVGSLNSDDILTKVKEVNKERVAVHTIGFGTLVDMDFLNKLSGQNGGVSRRVFESLDAAVQIHNFIEEVVTPVMKNVTISFENDKVEELTSNQVRTIFEGSEIIVAGKIQQNAFGEEKSRSLRSIRGQVRGKSMNNDVSIDFDIDASEEVQNDQPLDDKLFTERLWSYLRIKELLNKAKLAENSTVKDELKQAALNMSLSYNFVTPLTSLVTLKKEDKEELEKLITEDSEEEKREYLSKIEELEKRLELTKEKLIMETSTMDEEYEDVVEEDFADYSTEYEDDFEISSLRSSSLPSAFKAAGTARSGGGFYGDPHFVIPMANDFNLCFNWDGTTNQIYNLFHDANNDVVINGEFTITPRKLPRLSPRQIDGVETFHTFVSSIGFVFGEIPLIITITSGNVTMQTGNGARYRLPLNARSGMEISGVSVHVVEVHDSISSILVTTKKMTFKIISHTRRQTTPYLDFSILNNGEDAITSNESGRQFDGIIGQFVNIDVTHSRSRDDVIADGELTTAVINGKVAELKRRHRRDPATLEQVSCWQADDYAKGLTSYAREQYIVEGLVERPRYHTATKIQ